MQVVRILIIAGVVVATLLLAVIAVQALSANALLRRVRDDQMYRRGGGSLSSDAVGHALRSYSVVVVPTGTVDMTGLGGDPPALTEGVPHSCGGSLTTLTASYTDSCWLLLRRGSGDADRLWEDVAASKARYAIVAGCVCRLSAWRPPSAQERATNGLGAISDSHVVMSLYSVEKTTPMPARAGCVAVPVVQPLSGLSGAWASMSASLASGAEHPMHLLAF